MSEPTAHDLEPILADIMGIVGTFQENLTALEGRHSALTKHTSSIAGSLDKALGDINQLELVQTEILDGLHELLSQSRFCEAFQADARGLEWYNEIQRRIDPEGWKPVHQLPPNAKNVEHRDGNPSLKDERNG